MISGEELKALAVELAQAERRKARAAHELNALWDALDANGAEVEGSDQDEVAAVKRAGRAVEIAAAKWTEACMSRGNGSWLSDILDAARAEAFKVPAS